MSLLVRDAGINRGDQARFAPGCPRTTLRMPGSASGAEPGVINGSVRVFLKASCAASVEMQTVRPVVVDERIGIASRRLMRHHTACKKPADGIHLATALALSVDEMHTFDGSDLLSLDGKVNRAGRQAAQNLNSESSPRTAATTPELSFTATAMGSRRECLGSAP